MKNKRCKAILLVVLAVLVFSGLVLAGFGSRGRGGRPGSGFGPYGLSGYGIRGQDPGFGRGMHGGYGMGAFGVPMGPGRPGILSRPSGPGRAVMLLGILHRLDLTDEQIDKIKDIHNANKEKTEAAKKAIAEATKLLHEAVAEGADEAAIRAAGTKLGNAVSEQVILRATTITSIKKVLTDEQLTKLKELQEGMKDRIGKFREGMRGPAFRERLGRRGDAGLRSPHWGRGRELHPMGPPSIERPFEGEGRGYRQGWQTDRGRTPDQRWPEQGFPPRRR